MQRYKIKDKRAYRALWNHRMRLRRRGLDFTMDEMIELYRGKPKDEDVVLTSRDGSWTERSLCWRSRRWFYEQKSIDGLRLYQSTNGLWYSKKHKGSWRSREEAVESLK